MVGIFRDGGWRKKGVLGARTSCPHEERRFLGNYGI